MNKILTFFIAASFTTLSYAATPFGRIVDIKGSGFLSYGGKTQEIKKGDTIYGSSEIVIEHSGQVTFTDNADHQFHLGNASSVAVFADHVELRSGDMWFQSINKVDDYKITTANASVVYQGGEAIVSYDSSKGRSQLMVINGLMKLSNLMSPALNLTVGEGRFSFVDNAYEEGMPRDPTPAGEKTYGKLVSLFSGIAPLDKNSVAVFKQNDQHTATENETHGEVSKEIHKETAKVAVHETHGKVNKEITKTTKKEVKREIASAVAQDEDVALQEYKESILKISGEKNKVGPKKAGKAHALVKKMAEEKLVVQIYGQKAETTLPSVGRTRAPASVPELDTDHAVSPGLNVNHNDQTQNKEQYKQQDKESDKLIDQLNKL